MTDRDDEFRKAFELYAANLERQKNDDRQRHFREWTTIAGLFLAAGISGFQLYEMRKVYGPVEVQAESSKDSAKIAQKALEIGQRPWISIQLALVDDLKLEKAGGVARIRAAVKNNGNTVATDVNIKSTTTSFAAGRFRTNPPPPAGELKLSSELRAAASICTESDAMEQILDSAVGLTGDAIFPAEEFELFYDLSISGRDIEAAQKDELALVPAIQLCAKYRSPFDRQFHRSLVTYTLDGLGKLRGSFLWGGIPPNFGSIPKNSLKLNRVTGSFAD